MASLSQMEEEDPRTARRVTFAEEILHKTNEKSATTKFVIPQLIVAITVNAMYKL